VSETGPEGREKNERSENGHVRSECGSEGGKG